MKELARVTQIASHELRRQIPAAKAWVEEHPKGELELLQAFDHIVRLSNRSDNKLKRLAEKDGLKNWLILKNRLEGRQLPTINEILWRCDKDTRQEFKKVLRFTRKQMKQSELIHTKPRALVVGAIFHLYENWIFANPEYEGVFDPKVDGDRIVCALIEILSLKKTHPGYKELYKEVADKDRLDWINGDEMFSERFRLKNGFTKGIDITYTRQLRY